MKKHFGNFGLMIILVALIVLPFTGFKFVYVDSLSGEPQVLSGQNVRISEVVKDQQERQSKFVSKSRNRDTKEGRDSVFFSPKNLIKYLKRLSLTK